MNLPFLDYSFLAWTTPDQDSELARDATEKALAVDPNSAAAHPSLAQVKASYDHDWKRAIAQIDAAHCADPNIATPEELILSGAATRDPAMSNSSGKHRVQ